MAMAIGQLPRRKALKLEGEVGFTQDGKEVACSLGVEMLAL